MLFGCFAMGRPALARPPTKFDGRVTRTRNGRNGHALRKGGRDAAAPLLIPVACFSSSSPGASSSCPMEVVGCDVLILGSGIAGLTCALEVAKDKDLSVALVTKGAIAEGSTRHAQGGIAAVLGGEDSDSLERHIEDTVSAGAFLNDLQAVETMVEEGPSLVRELIRLGVDFTREASKEREKGSESRTVQQSQPTLHLGMEGGHSRARVVHAKDSTGKAVELRLVEAARAMENVAIYEHAFAVDLIHSPASSLPGKSTASKGTVCLGADVACLRTGKGLRFIASAATVLATGGAGQLYPSTTNPRVATGDGIAMAFRAGAEVASMEFIQFHPTTLYEPPKQRIAASADHSEEGTVFLVSEAVRGAGGALVNANRENFMKSYDSRAELAPRDIVARGIFEEMQKTNEKCVYLDATNMAASGSEGNVWEQFPLISSECKARLGLDISRDLCPVVPAQHYTCGGVQTDINGEASNVSGLFAIGEVAHTGVHGANRLASNSLLEGLVFGKRAAKAGVSRALRQKENPFHKSTLEMASQIPPSPLWFNPENGSLPSSSLPSPLSELRRVMWEHAGIVRSDEGLHLGLKKILLLSDHIRRLCVVEKSEQTRTPFDVELANMVLVAELVLRGAMMRKESRGLHFNVDHPKPTESMNKVNAVTNTARNGGMMSRRAIEFKNQTEFLRQHGGNPVCSETKSDKQVAELTVNATH
mmetsp:Transcript_3674/g.9226  ORF Transcript_3674/g.9226 Transcript_3674/m.9226 type:complete len:705 (-) Transcript_3674:924-3038(-)